MDKINGPWGVRVVRRVNDEYLDTLGAGDHYGDEYVAVVDASGNVVCDNADYYSAPIDPDHAHLIAAAPELLGMLKDTLENLKFVEKHYPGLWGYGVGRSPVPSVEAVIAKAMGSAEQEATK